MTDTTSTPVVAPVVHPAVSAHLSLIQELKALLAKIEQNLFHIHAATQTPPAAVPVIPKVIPAVALAVPQVAPSAAPEPVKVPVSGSG